MPAPISKIKLRNFKAFYGEEEEIDIGGKHLLMYGENGSGKSSIYWALYTLFQSATKSQAEVQKYFTPNQDEHLVNHEFLKEHISFAVDPQNGKILQPLTVGNNSSVQVELIDNESIRISHQGLTFGQVDVNGRQIPNTGNSQIIEDFNRRSDFISHRLLINFYNFRNSKQINLWEVFVRDIFPFLLNTSQNQTLGQMLQYIESNKPFFDFSGNTFKLRRRGGSIRDNYEDKIAELNTEINRWIGEINRLVNDFYKKHFQDNRSSELQIQLEFKEELNFDDNFQSAQQGNNTFYMYSKNHVDLNDPIILIHIKHKDQNGNWVLVERPQSYFNEAKLTQIALSVRFSLLDETIRTSDEGKILALDDLLISLDMGNRNKVLDIILKEFAPKYKIFLFTHERAFFNMVKERLSIFDLKEDWIEKEIYMNSFIQPPKPKIVESENYISKAEYYLHQFDLAACANAMRRYCEEQLKRILPTNLSLTTQDDGLTKYRQLNDLIAAFLKFYKDMLECRDGKFDLLNQYKTLILNPLSHDNQNSEFYASELSSCIDLLKSLKDVSKQGEIPVDTELYLDQLDISCQPWTYKLQLQSNLLAYKLPDGSIKVLNPTCRALGRKNSTKEEVFCNDFKIKSFSKMAYKHAMKGKDLEEEEDFLTTIYNENGLFLKEILKID